MSCLQFMNQAQLMILYHVVQVPGGGDENIVHMIEAYSSSFSASSERETFSRSDLESMCAMIESARTHSA